MGWKEQSDNRQVLYDSNDNLVLEVGDDSSLYNKAGTVLLNGAGGSLSTTPSATFARKMTGSRLVKIMPDARPMEAAPDRDSLRNWARGFLAQPYETGMAGFNALTPVSQTLYGALIGLLKDDWVTNILVPVVTAGAGTVPTSIKVALYDSTGARVAVSSELKASAIWTPGGVTTYAVAPLSAPYQVLVSGGFYACFLQDSTAAWSVTAMQIGRGAGTGGQQGSVGTGVPASVTMAAQTTPPTTATFAVTGIATWIGVS